MNSMIKNLTNRRTKILQKVDHSNHKNVTCTLEIASSITEKIQEIQKIQYDSNKIIAKANWRLQGELVNKYWCTHSKEKKGHNTIMELCRTKSDPVSYTTNSKEMTNNMAIYHEPIQQKNQNNP